MGWTFTHKPKGQKIKAFFEKEFNSEHGKVLDCATKNRVAYIAFERKTKHNLEIISLHDARARCDCGGWDFSYTGELSKEQIEARFRTHTESAIRIVFALICLLSYRPRDHFNFGYKDMDESMGPFECDCPERILDLLTDTDYESAGRWRKRCRENLAKEKAIKGLQPGMVIELGTELTCTDGRKMKRLMLVSKRPLVFAAPNDQAIKYKVGRGLLKTWPWTASTTI